MRVRFGLHGFSVMLRNYSLCGWWHKWERPSYQKIEKHFPYNKDHDREHHICFGFGTCVIAKEKIGFI